MGRIRSVNRGDVAGEKKRPVGQCNVLKDRGLAGDAHAGTERQVSLLAVESIRKMRDRGFPAEPGDFAENLTTEGIDLVSLPLGTRLKAGRNVILEITRIGKECHDRCAIYLAVGDCVMPREGVFARVVAGGVIADGDILEIMGSNL